MEAETNPTCLQTRTFKDTEISLWNELEAAGQTIHQSPIQRLQQQIKDGVLANVWHCQTNEGEFLFFVNTIKCLVNSLLAKATVSSSELLELLQLLVTV